VVRIRSTQEERHIKVFCLVFVASFAACLIAALTNELSFRSSSLLPRSLGVDGKFGMERRIGKIIFDRIDSTGCQEAMIDNQTGYISAVTRSCEAEIGHDASPVPTGTIQRLDAISRAFSRR
jgi:hypothetical protein